MIAIKNVDPKDSVGLQQLEQFAGDIWRDHYTPIIGEEQVEYMLGKFQSEAAMQAQLQSGYHYYTLWDGGELCGYFAYELREDSLFISKLYVHASRRGRGLGRVALDFLVAEAKNHQRPKFSLTVNKYNSNSIAAYEKMGFYKAESIVIDIGAGFVMDDFLMEKTLD